MIELIIDKLQDVRFLTTVFTSIAAVATVLTFAMPYLSNDNLSRRMKSVAIERNKIRAREREKLAKGEKVNLRSAPKPYMQMVVENLNLRKWLGEEEVRATLVQAGYRGQGPYVAFLFFRMVAPIAMFLFALAYLFVLTNFKYPPLVKFGISIGAAYRQEMIEREIDTQTPAVLGNLYWCRQQRIEFRQPLLKAEDRVLPAEIVQQHQADVAFFDNRARFCQIFPQQLGKEGFPRWRDRVDLARRPVARLFAMDTDIVASRQAVQQRIGGRFFHRRDFAECPFDEFVDLVTVSILSHQNAEQ